MFASRVMLLAGLACAAMDCGAPPASVTVNDFGDAGPGDCNSTCTLRDAISVALASVTPKAVVFAGTTTWPQTITLTNGQLSINNTTGSTLNVIGPGALKLAVSATNLTRVLEVSTGTSYLSGLTLRDGKVIGATPSTQPFGSGLPGQGGGSALGGCVEVDNGAALTIYLSDIRNCVALGGTGGGGGSGVSGSSGGIGGTGGDGGGAAGGGIYSAGNLTFVNSSLVNTSATSGGGGKGGDGGPGFPFLGPGGSGGAGGVAAGAGIAIAIGGSILIRNSTLADAIAAGGNGGIGGNGSEVNPSGNGGNGGNVTGGLLYTGASIVVADLEFATLASGTAVAGAGGLPGATGTPKGTGGQPGVARGAGIHAAGTSVIVASSVVVGPPSAAVCYGQVAIDPGSVNLDSDSSCPGFTLHDTLAHVLAPLNLATTSWPGYEPVFHSSIIDAAGGCTQIGGVVAVVDDQHGTARPQGVKCDLGAIESDYVFANGFD